MLQFYKHSEIDLEKWDECVLKSENGIVYMMSWYLNIIHPDWEALIAEKENEYFAIMPMLGKKKWWLYFHPNPPLVQRFGLIYASSSTSDLFLKEALNFFTRKFVLFKYPLHNNVKDFNTKTIGVHQCKNYILKLDKKYDEVFSNYRKNRKRHLQKAQNSDLEFRYTRNPVTLLRLFCSEVTGKIYGGVSEKTVEHIQLIAQHVIDKQCGFIAEIVTESDNVISTGLFIRYKNRLIYLVGANNFEGRIKNASTLLLNEVIYRNSEKNMILDFEGSDVPGIADFYRSFGSDYEPYYLMNYESRLVSKILKAKRFLFHFKTLI